MKVPTSDAQTHSKVEQSSILFTALFASKYWYQLCPDNGADGNILDKETLRRIGAAGVYLQEESLSQPRVFGKSAANADGVNSNSNCTKSISIDAVLHIMHSSTL